MSGSIIIKRVEDNGDRHQLDYQSPGESLRYLVSAAAAAASEEDEDEEEERQLSISVVKKTKIRNNDPGRRVINGRVYDSALGKTCHWCRQKTVDDRVECSREGCAIKFCLKCLLNRHGERISEQSEEGVRWVCPKCRGGCGPGCEKNCCNCGPCRKSRKLGATGQMVQEARKNGFTNVHDYLIHQQTGESPETIARRKIGRHWVKPGTTVVSEIPPSTTRKRPQLQQPDDIPLTTPLHTTLTAAPAKKMRGSLTGEMLTHHLSQMLEWHAETPKPAISSPEPSSSSAKLKLESLQQQPEVHQLGTCEDQLRRLSIESVFKLEKEEEQPSPSNQQPAVDFQAGVKNNKAQQRAEALKTYSRSRELPQLKHEPGVEAGSKETLPQLKQGPGVETGKQDEPGKNQERAGKNREKAGNIISYSKGVSSAPVEESSKASKRAGGSSKFSTTMCRGASSDHRERLEKTLAGAGAGVSKVSSLLTRPAESSKRVCKKTTSYRSEEESGAGVSKVSSSLTRPAGSSKRVCKKTTSYRSEEESADSASTSEDDDEEDEEESEGSAEEESDGVEEDEQEETEEEQEEEADQLKHPATREEAPAGFKRSSSASSPSPAAGHQLNSRDDEEGDDDVAEFEEQAMRALVHGPRHLLNEGDDDEDAEFEEQAKRAVEHRRKLRAASKNKRMESCSYAHLLVGVAPGVKQEPLAPFDDDSDDEDDESGPTTQNNSSVTEQQDSGSDSDGGSGEGFREKLERELQKPFDGEQLREMMVEASRRKAVIKHRETRNRLVCFETSHEGASYLDQYPDLAAKISAASEEEQLRLLRGFFFWIQHVCNAGSFKPWASGSSSEDGDEVQIQAPDCEITGVVVSLTEKRAPKTLVTLSSCGFSAANVKTEKEN